MKPYFSIWSFRLLIRRNRAIFPCIFFLIALRGFLLCADWIAALSSSDFTYKLLKLVVFLPDKRASLKDTPVDDYRTI